jgi:hypothetical protein
MYPPTDLSWEKCGMVWVEIKVLQENMMNNTKCRQELNWALVRGRKDGVHHRNYRKITSDQHRLSSNILDMDSQVGEFKFIVMMVGSKFDKWQGAKFLEWSRIMYLLVLCNSNALEALILLILKIVWLEEVF